MAQIELDDETYRKAQIRATAEGYSSVEEYVASLLIDELTEANVDRIFTPQVIAHLDRVSADVKAGAKTYTLEEVEEHFEKKREAWLRKPAS